MAKTYWIKSETCPITEKEETFLEECELGNLVKLEDYEKLEKENINLLKQLKLEVEKVNRQVEELKEALKHALNTVHHDYDDVDAFKEHWQKEYDLVYDDSGILTGSGREPTQGVIKKVERDD